MHILRRIGLALLAAVLPFLLFALAFDFWVINTVSHPTNIKNILADSGLYTNFVPSTLSQANAQSGDQNNDLFAQEAVKKAAQQTLSAQFLQQSSENVIDGIYDWLNGKTALPDFKIDLATKKVEFANDVATNAKQMAANLPKCKTVAEAEANSGGDIFNASCVPKAITPDQIGDQVKQEILSNQDFLNSPSITADTFKQSGSNRSVFEGAKAQKAPGYYQKAKTTPFILIILTVLDLAGIVLLSLDHLKGLRRVGSVLLTIGVMMLIGAFLLGRAHIENRVPLNFTGQGAADKVLTESIQKVIKDLVHLLDNNYWIFGGIYAGIGAACLTTALVLKRRNNNLIDLTKKNSAPASEGTDSAEKVAENLPTTDVHKSDQSPSHRGVDSHSD